MDETKTYYLGTGTEFIKAQCKPYKTIERALKAAAKDESLVVWDEDGNIIGSLTDVVPDGALETNGDGSVNAYDADGQQVGTVNAETVAAVTGDKSQSTGGEDMQQGDTETAKNGTGDNEQANTQPDAGNGENGANTQPQNTGDEKVQQDGAPAQEQVTATQPMRSPFDRPTLLPSPQARQPTHRPPETRMCSRMANRNRNRSRNRLDDSTSRSCARVASD